MISNRHSVTLLSVLTVLFLTTCKPEKEEPKPLTAPVLTTMEAGDITAISALSGGAISSDGGSPVTARGIVWSISHNPTLSDSVSEEGTGIGSFTSDLTPLKYSTTYYVRAYATNSIGTSYGNEITFNTKAAVPSDGLVGWWPFNGNANDESGNGNNGVVNGATLNNDRFGYSENSFEFDGIDDFIATTDIDLINTATLSAWINPVSNIGSIVSKTRDGIDNAGFELIYNNSQHGLYGHVGWSGVTANNIFPDPIYPLNFNGWNHTLMVINNGNVDIYLNGEKIFSETSLNNITQNDEVIQFGKSIWGGNLFQGILDDIAIYNRALTAEEIQKIYNGTGF